jgi:hypothetical protein
MSMDSNPLQKLYFSYNQFMVYDASVRLPGCAWTDQHFAQGFARRESTVNFATLLEFGYAHVEIGNVYQAQREYSRVIAVPFLVTSGKIEVAGPEEVGVKRIFPMPGGNYRLVAAQRLVDDEDESIDLYFEPVSQPLRHSSVLVADGTLRVPLLLLESSEIAGEL